MPPIETAECRRCNRRRLCLWLLPAGGMLGLVAAGLPLAAAALFLAVSALFICGTLRPASRLFGPHERELGAAQAARGEVWITFDDGPDPVTTPLLLECLARHEVRAGFFLIGDKARRHPELVRAIAAAGHVIGNHSQSHPAGRFWSLLPGAMWRQIAGCQQTLTELTGRAPHLFRPPAGHHNPFVAAPLQTLGLKMVLWNCRGFDAVQRDPRCVLRLLEASLKPGAIVLLHDGRVHSVQLLEALLMALARRSLRPAVPSTLLC